MTPQPAPSSDADGWSAGAYIRFGIFCVLLLAGGLGTWSATAQLAGAVIATGQLRVESQRQVVQHPDGGVVGEIQVRDGDVVKAGDVLITLDGTSQQSELTVLESQLFEIMARRARLVAEQTGAPGISFDQELLDISHDNPDVAALLTGQQALYDARAETLSQERGMLVERQAQISEQISGSSAETEALERQAELIEQELVGQRKLLAQGLAQANRVLSLEREAARIEGERGQMVAQTAQLRGQIAEIGIELVRLDSSQREDAITQLRDLGYRELELKEQRIALKERLSRLDVTAPRSGIIYDMSVHALKAVVRPADPILYVVPTDTDLVVDAQIDPINIDEIQPGQEAVLRFSAFNSRTTPEVFGRVVRVSPDAFTEEQSGRTFYRADVSLPDDEITKLEGQELLPGMPVEVYIQTGKRTAINYLMKPLTDYFSRALREE